MENIERRSQEIAMIDKVLNAQKAIMDVDSVLGLKSSSESTKMDHSTDCTKEDQTKETGS